MRFAYHNLGLEVELNPEKAVVLVIENPKAKRELVEDLWLQCAGKTGKSVFSDNGKDINISRQIEVILNPFSVDFNSKRIKGHLLDEANVVVREYEYQDFLELKGAFLSFMEKVFERMPYPLKLCNEMNPDSIMKYSDVHIDIEDMEMPERIICYLKLIQQICHVKGAVFVDICSYLLAPGDFNHFEPGYFSQSPTF